MQKLKILLVTGEVTGEHDYRKSNEWLRTVLEATGRFEVRITEAFAGSTAATLKPYHAVLLNYDGKKTPADTEYIRWGDETEDAFFNYIQNGGGLVLYHSSIALENNLPDRFKRVWGAYLTGPYGRRNPKDEMVVHIADGSNPITKGLPESFFVINDDFLAGVTTHPEAELTVLATVFDTLENYRVPNFPPKHQPVEIPDGKLENLPGINTQQPISWTNRYGNGRIFALSLGHEIETLWRVPYMVMLCRGLEWAATGEVTIEPPDRTGENRLKKWPFY